MANAAARLLRLRLQTCSGDAGSPLLCASARTTTAAPLSCVQTLPKSTTPPSRAAWLARPARFLRGILCKRHTLTAGALPCRRPGGRACACRRQRDGEPAPRAHVCPLGGGRRGGHWLRAPVPASVRLRSTAPLRPARVMLNSRASRGGQQSCHTAARLRKPVYLEQTHFKCLAGQILVA